MRTAPEEREQFATVDCEMAGSIRSSLYRGNPDMPSYRTDLRPFLAAHREGERAAIVAWLRDRANHRHPDYAYAAVFAEAISRGDHLTAEEPQ